MTILTHRNYIEPVFWFIPFVVVVVLCRFAARALQGIQRRQLACCDSTVYGSTCFMAFWMKHSISFFNCLAFLALSFSFLTSSAFIRFGVFGITSFINLFTLLAFYIYFSFSFTLLTLLLLFQTLCTLVKDKEGKNNGKGKNRKELGNY